VFESDRGEKSQPFLYTMTPTGTALRRLTTFAASGINELGADWQRIGPGPPGCTIWGTRGDDLLTGTPARDILCGGAGIDRIVGNGGGDRLEGGPGPDQLGGEDGDDTLIGGTGRDRIFGGRGRDRIEARDRAADFVDGGPADDRARADPVDRLWRVEGRL
jgi:Ca2+-binding RTX toxin-like protein